MATALIGLCDVRNDERKAYTDSDALRVERDSLRAEVTMLRMQYDKALELCDYEGQTPAECIKERDVCIEALQALVRQERGSQTGRIAESRIVRSPGESTHTATGKDSAESAAHAQTPKHSHPVKVGEWVRKTTDGLMYKIGDKFRLESYEIKDGQIWCNLDNGASWLMSVCEPCDPPADHDTPAGKEAAEAVIRDSQTTEIKVGDVVEVVSASSCATFSTDIGRRGKVTHLGDKTIDVKEVPGYALPSGGVVGICDVRKVTQ